MPGVLTDQSDHPAASSLPAELVRGLGQKHIPGLDGLRAIAVSLVILYHAGLPLPGGTGVLLFFVLSGFLITWLLLQEADKTGTVSLRNFYARRTLRILPAFYVYAAALLAMAWLRHRPVNYPQLTAALLYVNNYWQGIHGDPNTGFSHTWSLAVEEQFYILWPGVFLLLRRDLSRMARLLAGAIAFVWIYRLALVALHVNQGYIYEAFDTRADSLMTGCLLAVLLHEGIAARLFAIVCSARWTIVPTLLLLSLSAAAEFRYGADYRDTIGFALNGLLAFVLIVQVVGGAAGFLNVAPVRYLGRISYSMYLWQQIVPEAAGKGVAHFYPGIHPALRIALEYAAVVAVASASWFCVEKPILRLKRKFGAVT